MRFAAHHQKTDSHLAKHRVARTRHSRASAGRSSLRVASRTRTLPTRAYVLTSVCVCVPSIDGRPHHNPGSPPNQPPQPPTIQTNPDSMNAVDAPRGQGSLPALLLGRVRAEESPAHGERLGPRRRLPGGGVAVSLPLDPSRALNPHQPPFFYEQQHRPCTTRCRTRTPRRATPWPRSTVQR